MARWTDKVRETVERAWEVVSDVFAPQPELIPIPVRTDDPYRRRHD